MNSKTSILTANDDLKAFYDFGKQIRSQSTDNSTWGEPEEIKFYFDQTSDNVQFYLCEDGEELGRVAAYYHHVTSDLGMLGWYECDDNDALSEEMLTAAIEWLQSKGCKKIIGPINGSTWSSYRFNLSASKPLFAGEPYQPSYYPIQWEKAGFVNDVMYETTIPVSHVNPKINDVDLDTFFDDLKLSLIPLPREISEEKNAQYFKFYAECFKDNPLFHDISLKHYDLITEKLTDLVDYKCSFIVEDYDHNPVSAYISFKDVYGRFHPEEKGTKLFLKTISTHPLWRQKDIMQLVVNHIFTVSEELGYSETVFCMLYSGNVTATKTKSRFGSNVLRNYALMSKDVK